MEKQSVVLRVPKVLLERIDKFKEQRGFGTRTQAIFYLVNYALEQLQAGDSSHLRGGSVLALTLINVNF